MKRGFILLIAALLAVLTSCADKDIQTEVTVTSESEDTTTVDTTVDITKIKYNFNDQKYNIAYIFWSLYNGNILVEEEIGETINDAVYKRQIAVEDSTGVKLSMIDLGKIADTYTKVNAAVMAGDNTYQLVLSHNYGSVSSMATSQILLDFKKLPGIDLTKPYWKQNANETFSIDGIQLYAVSDFIRADPNAIFFNKGMIDSFKLESPYKLVDDGVWTWNKLSEMAKFVSEDINGDGIMDSSDRYGFVGELGWQFTSVMHSCNQFIVEKDSDGIPQIVMNSEKMQNIVDMVYSLLYNDDKSFTWGYDPKTDPNIGGIPPVDFGAGNALFYLVPLTTSINYRATETDFGILPFPKYDENQEKYLSLDWSGLMSIPISVPDKDKEMVGIVTELLAYYSHEYTVPAYYDVLLNSKVTRDDDSRHMLDIIYSNLVYDYGLNFAGDKTELLYTLFNLMKAKSTDFASFYAKNSELATAQYFKVYDAHCKIK